MRRGFGNALRIGVAPGSVALVRTGGWPRARATVLAQRSFTAERDTLGQQLRELVAGAGIAGWPVTLVLSDELVRLWQVNPPPAAARKADLEAAAALRFQALFGAAAGSWKISADWDAARPFL